MNELLEEIDQPIIRMWNACHSVEDIADTLGIDEEYIEAVIDEPSNYSRE